jgi:hypothetical protein
MDRLSFLAVGDNVSRLKKIGGLQHLRIGSEDIGKLKGKVVRLFFELADADVYAFQIRP